MHDILSALHDERERKESARIVIESVLSAAVNITLALQIVQNSNVN